MFILLIVTLANQVCAPTSGVLPGRELFTDPGFERGFVLTAASHPAPKVEIGVLQTTERPADQPPSLRRLLKSPAWRLAQWATQYLLEPGKCTDQGGCQWTAENPGKRIVVDRAINGVTGLWLESRGIAEYAGRMRVSGEVWPHLLIEQRFDVPIRLQALKGLKLSFDMRIAFCKVSPEAEGKLNPGLHTAQMSAFWTIHNMNESSPDYQDMIWFGIPIFDARYDIPPPHYAIDSGKADASGKFICLLDGKRFWTGRTGDGQWQKLDTDLLPLIREGLAISQEKDYLKNTRFEDLAITTFNMGWEIPGPYDAAAEIRGLSMKAEDQ